MEKDERLRKKEDFEKLYKKGVSSASHHVVLLVRKNDLAYNRTAFLASKKVGNSVKRNRARRLMKEAFRTTEMVLPSGFDFLFIARNTITDAKCADVRKSIAAALKRSDALRKKK